MIRPLHSQKRHGTSDLPRFAGLLDRPFLWILWLIAGFYVFTITAMLVSMAMYAPPLGIGETPGAESPFNQPPQETFLGILNDKDIRFSIRLSLISCTLSMIFSLWVAIPLGYVMSRYRFPGKVLVDAVLDIPIVLPPLVVGLCLLILFMTRPGRFIEEHLISFTYLASGVVLAQFMVACAFAVRTMRATFDQISPRQEQVALTLGCSRSQAFWLVLLPEARNGIMTAATLAWARSLGEFGPILIFAGATRRKTEVLATTIFLEMSTGRIEVAVAVSLMMVTVAMAVLIILRLVGADQPLRGVM